MDSGRESESSSVDLGVLRLQRGGAGVLLGDWGVDQAVPFLLPCHQAERSESLGSGCGAQLCSILPDVALLQARSRVGGPGAEPS